MTDWNPDEVRLNIARDLREIVRLYAGLRIEAVNRAGDPNIPGGEAMVMLGPGADVEAFGYMQLSAIFGRIEDEAVEEVLKSDTETPLAFLASWTDIVREERGQEPSRRRASVEAEVAYLARATEWMLSTNDDGEPWFLPVDDFASGLKRVRYALETVLRDGDRPTRINAECDHCDKHPRLVIEHGDARDGSEDGWKCPRCERPFDESQVRQAWRKMLVRRGNPPEWIRLRDAAMALNRPVETVRDWTITRAHRDGEPRVESKVRDDGRTWVRWSDARATDDTTKRRSTKGVA